MRKISIKSIIWGIGFTSTGILLGWIIFDGPSDSIAHEDHEHSTMVEVYTCSMHPQIRESEEGKCPLCGMDLIPVSSMTSKTTGSNEIQMTDAAVEIANIQTVIVGMETPRKQIYLPGKVAADERNMATVTAHFNGRVERLYADFTGQFIRKGQKLATLYSPDLVTAQKELFEALRFKESNPAFYEAAVQKLKLWELTSDQIREIERKGEVQFYFDVYAPRSGTIMTRKITEGEHVMDGQVLFEIVNLASLWVLFDAYESDLHWLSEGDSISFKVASIPGRSFKSVITFIDPIINQETRTASIRAEIRNESSQLKPEMFVEGMVSTGKSGMEEKLVIPKTAVLWTGKRAVVYVKVRNYDQPTFQFREVEIGVDAGEYYVVNKGLKEGEEVVANGVFKIDASAQLQGKVSMMNPSGGEVKLGHDHGSRKMDQLEAFDFPDVILSEVLYEVSPEFQNQLRKVFTSYLNVKDALIKTDGATAKKQAKPLLASIEEVDMTLVKGDAHHSWMKDLNVLHTTTKYMLEQSDVERIRDALSPLSDQLYHTLTKFQVETGGFRQFCPMAFDFQGAFWLSDSDEILNPYFGDEMLTCGNIEEEMK